jgi:hypothetical protein
MVPGMKSAECNMLQIVEIFLIRVSSNYILKKTLCVSLFNRHCILKNYPLTIKQKFQEIPKKKTRERNSRVVNPLRLLLPEYKLNVPDYLLKITRKKKWILE